MSMSVEHAEELKNEAAVVCCRTEEGTIIEASNLEDPDIFPDMVDSGLLTIPKDCLKVGQVIGAKLLKTIDSLTPLTSDILEGVKKMEDEAENNSKDDSKVEEQEEVVEGDQIVAGEVVDTTEGRILKIRIEEGKGIDIELPF